MKLGARLTVYSEAGAERFDEYRSPPACFWALELIFGYFRMLSYGLHAVLARNSRAALEIFENKSSKRPAAVTNPHSIVTQRRDKTSKLCGITPMLTGLSIKSRVADSLDCPE
jgi:hypothetical protein